MIARNFIVAVCVSFIFSFQVHAFNLKDFGKKILEEANKTQHSQNRPQGKPANEDTSERSVSQSSISNRSLPKFNIRGLYLGMPMKDGMTLLKKLKPQLFVTPGSEDIGNIDGSRISGPRYFGGLSASTDTRLTAATDSTEKFSVVGNPPPNTETVMGIGRAVTFGRDKVLLSDLKALLMQKYGEPVFAQTKKTGENSAYYLLSWSLDPKGEPQKNEDIIMLCNNTGGIITHAQGDGRISNNYHKCGFTFVIKLAAARVTYSKQPVVINYSIVLYDGNENRKSVNKTIVYTQNIAKKIEAEKMEKLRKRPKPQL